MNINKETGEVWSREDEILRVARDQYGGSYAEVDRAASMAKAIVRLEKYHDITREIGIDAGHRIPNHASKCKSFHGHRYTIQATVRGPLVDEGSSEGMTLDFGFLKEIMMREIDGPCDHGMILWDKDPKLDIFLSTPSFLLTPDQVYEALGPMGKLYVVPFVPTAENLSRHWFHRMSPHVLQATQERARLINVRVYETPNCWSDYPGRE